MPKYQPIVCSPVRREVEVNADLSPGRCSRRRYHGTDITGWWSNGSMLILPGRSCVCCQVDIIVLNGGESEKRLSRCSPGQVLPGRLVAAAGWFWSCTQRRGASAGDGSESGRNC